MGGFVSQWWDGLFQEAQPWGCTAWTAEPRSYNPACPILSDGYRHEHRGIDIMVPAGTSLKAPCAGVSLSQIGYDPYGFGPNYPILRMPDGRQIVIGHTSRVVGSPRLLARGEVFAISGSEGMSTGPHVHFQANASPGDFLHTVDPVPYLNPSQEDDMTPDEHNLLVSTAIRVAQIIDLTGGFNISDEIGAIKAKVDTLTPGSSPDVTELKAAINKLSQHLGVSQ